MNIAAYDAPRPAPPTAAGEVHAADGVARIGVAYLDGPTPNGASPVTDLAGWSNYE